MDKAVAAASTALDDDPLRLLEPGWMRLGAGRGSPMQQYIWTSSFAETFQEAGAVRIIAAGPPGSPTALAPLVQRPGPFGALEALGVRQLFEPMDVLSADPEALSALALAIAGQGRALVLPRIPADSALIPALRAAYRGRGYLRVVPTDGYPYIPLDRSWQEPMAKFNAGRRSDFRRAWRHAEKLGLPSLEVLTPSLLELPALLDEAWAVEAAGWKGERGSALARDALRGSFFRRYARAACGQGVLRLAFMRINGRPVAMQLAAETANRLWLLKIGLDEAFARCSPGQQLMMHVVSHAAQRGLDSVEFLGQAETWTELWTRTMRPCASLRAYPFELAGLARLAADSMAYLGRRLANAI